MPAAILEYTTYADVRAALGTNVDELPDTTLALDLYAFGLNVELEAFGDALPADYTTIKAIPEGTRTAAEQKVYAAAVLFATYSVAVQLASSLPLFSPHAIADGKATMTRYADSPYKVAIAEARKNYDRYSKLLAAKYATYKSTVSTAVTRTYLNPSKPTTDPVTG